MAREWLTDAYLEEGEEGIGPQRLGRLVFNLPAGLDPLSLPRGQVSLFTVFQEL
jgi:hypothetical protein